jgi:class 3 adenylate cyclase
MKQSFDNEIEMIDDSLLKISKLLMLCYGEAGATVVSKMITNDTAFLDFAEERGSKVLAIFAFCDIRNFTDATEVFQESVISLVNQVASIVHSNTIRYGGEPNKNIGDAFLLVWRLT